MKVVMMGTGAFAEPTFEALLSSRHVVVGLVTQPDRAVGQERSSTRQVGKGMKTIAVAHGVPVYQPETINTPEGVAQLQAWTPDLLVVAAYGQILARDVLLAAPLGGINVHASLLPKYRGAAPIAWAIANGETRTGVTIIRMTVQLDAGDMVAQEAIDIRPDETAGELEARLAPLGATLALRVVDQLEAGTLPPGLKQDKTLVTKAPKLTKEHGEIDWSRHAIAVANHVRAMQPWPTAYTHLHRRDRTPLRLLVAKAVPFPQPVASEVPAGAALVESRLPRSLLVAAGLDPNRPDQRSVVELVEIQPAGKKRMHAADFLRGHPLLPDDRFGPAILP